jgi:plastocyanin
MKKSTILLTSLLSLFFSVKATQHTITNSGTTFTPSEITINVGDDILFNLASIHNAVEVSQSTYMANGSTSNGGFSLPLGGGTVHFSAAGTYYYVCEPHASSGMKGIIHVVLPSDVSSVEALKQSFITFPNPVENNLTLSYSLQHSSKVEIKLLNVNGGEIAQLLNTTQSAGTQNLEYTTGQNLAPGIYFIQIKIDDGILTRKLLIK